MLKCIRCNRYFYSNNLIGSAVCDPCFNKTTRRDPVNNWKYEEPNLFNQDEIDECDKQYQIDQEEFNYWKNNFPYGDHWQWKKK